MTNPTPKRLRLRFTLRTLAILVTLVCAYAACWSPTVTRGEKDVITHIFDSDELPGSNPVVECPLVVSVREFWWPCRSAPPRNCYYFWFFGFVAKLPFETTVDELPQLLESSMYSGPHPDYESGRQGKQ